MHAEEREECKVSENLEQKIAICSCSVKDAVLTFCSQFRESKKMALPLGNMEAGTKLAKLIGRYILIKHLSIINGKAKNYMNQ